MKVYIYPGSFDPVTYGHLDIIQRASKLCDKLIVAVLINVRKSPLFSLEERVNMLKPLLIGYNNIEITSFSGLLVNHMVSVGATVIIKGLRAISDFEYEFQMEHINKIQNSDIETLFMMTSLNHSFISSSSVKELARVGGNIDRFVPILVRDAVLRKYKELGVE